MDTRERIRKLYERLPAGSAFRKAIEQVMDLAEDLTDFALGPRERAAEPSESEEPRVTVER